MDFVRELDRALPADIPERQRLIEKAAAHLALILEANEFMNLTRITDPREAAIKHIYDSVAPWRHFAGAQRVLDAGTGAGFPGIPLATIFPQIRFALCESIQKKARFVDTAVESLELHNAHVFAERAEQIAITQRPDIITARAVAPISRLVDLFGNAMKQGTRLVLFKGPDVEKELHEAGQHRVHADVLCRYDLPDDLGTRTLLELRARTQSRNGAVRQQAVVHRAH